MSKNDDRLREASEFLERVLKNQEGCRKGYGHCFICGDSSMWKDHYNIPIEINDRGHISSEIFPYCIECHENKNNNEKIAAIRKLINIWIANTPDNINKYLENEQTAIDNINYYEQKRSKNG